MKHLFWLFAALCAMPLAAEMTKEGDGAVKLEKGTRELAFQLLLREKLAHFSDGKFPASKAKITDEMRRAPQNYTSRKIARQRTEKLYRAEMENFLRNEVDKIARSTIGILDATQRRAADAALRRTVDQKMKELFPAAFDEARNQLAAEERKSQIFAVIYPTGEELEKFSDADLAKKLFQRFSDRAKRPVMEENLPYLRQTLISHVIVACRKQQETQKKLLAQLRVPQTLWAANDVEKFLRRELRTAVEREIPEAKEHFIAFPAVEQTLRFRAQNIAVERIRDAMPDMLNVQKYRALLEEEPQLHATWQASEKRIAALFLPALLVKISDELHAPQEVKSKIKAEDPAIQKFFSDAARKKFQAARQDHAERQFKRVWSDFDAWLPRLEETELFVRQGENALPDTIADRPASDEILFTETQEKIDAEMRQKFIAEAKRLKIQRQAVETVYRPIAEECQKLHKQQRAGETGFFQKLFGLAPDALTLDEIIKIYSEKVETSASRPLFPVIRQEIEIRARAILQQIQTSALPDVKEDAPEEEEKRKSRTFILLVGGNSDTELHLQLGAWQQKLNGGELPAQTIAEELKRQIDGKEIDMIVSIEVANSAVTYRRVAELRDALQKLLPDAMIQDIYRK